MSNQRNYRAFYRGTQVAVEATSSYAAQKAAADLLGVKPGNRYQVAVVVLDEGSSDTATNPAALY